jgi:hypothetical protein
MRRLPLPLARLLALVLLLQAALAPALCIGAVNANTLHGVICGPESSGRSISIALGDPDDAAQAMHGFCPLCASLPAVADLPAPVLPRPAWIRLGIAWVAAPAHALPAQARAPPAQPRAPPSIG